MKSQLWMKMAESRPIAKCEILYGFKDSITEVEAVGLCIIKRVASNKSSLLLKIQKLNTQTLQWLTMIIKIESIFKSN